LEVKCTREEYVTRSLWLGATLDVCPFHGEGCELCPHGYYNRVEPPGCRIRRLLCRRAGVTVSLLPDFLCARLSSTMAEAEQVVRCALLEGVAAAGRKMRPRCRVEGREAWVRRRLYPVLAAVTVVCGLLPGALGEAQPRHWETLERALDTTEVLEAIRRSVPPDALQELIKPVGFRQGRRSRAPP
jgi:hypothetical protein